MLDRFVNDSNTFYSWVITVILFILFTYLNGLKKLFYSANVMKEGIFSKWRGSGLANKYTMFWISETGDNKFQVFDRGIQKGRDMY